MYKVFLFLSIILQVLFVRPVKASVYPPTIDKSFFERKDILYSSEIASWSLLDGRFDGQYMLNYKNSCPNCSKLSKEAKIPVVRWAPWSTFPDQISPLDGKPGTLTYEQFNNIIDGIRNTLDAHPFIKLQPIYDTSFCPDTWGVDNLISMNKSIIKAAGSRVQLYEFANEIVLQCKWFGPGIGGVKAGQYWLKIAPVLKKYARSLGFEIYIGGPSSLSDAAEIHDFLYTIRMAYNSNPDPDMIPDFITWHEYPNADTNNVLTSLPPIAARIDAIKSSIANLMPEFKNQIKLVVSEYNIHSDGMAHYYEGGRPIWYANFLKLLREKDVFMANQFLMASNTVDGSGMDLITFRGTPSSYYDAFKQASLTDPQAIQSRNSLPKSLAGDLNGDGKVNLYDYTELIRGYSTLYTDDDFINVLANYGK